MKTNYFFGLIFISVTASAQYNVNNQIMRNQQQQQQIMMMNQQQRLMLQQQEFMRRMMQNSQRNYVSAQSMLAKYKGNSQKLESEKRDLEKQLSENLIKTDNDNQNFTEKTDEKNKKLQQKIEKINKKLVKNAAQEKFWEAKIVENEASLQEAKKKHEEAKLKKEEKKKAKQST